MKPQSYSLAQLSQLVNGQLQCDANLVITGLASLEQAQPHQISFVNADKYIDAANRSHAGALIISAALRPQVQHEQCIVVENPYLAFAQLTHVFEAKNTARGIEPTAIVHPTATIGADVYLGHYVVVAENCHIGAHTIIESHSKIAAGVHIGESCWIDSHVSILGQSKIQNRVRIHANSVIGSEGFGFAPYAGKWHRIAQLGAVQIGNDVRIGSNCSIDRGALDDTIIEEGVVIDNLVQIAHNVHIGAHSAIAAKCGIAGSTKIGKHCVLAGACGVAGHLNIADHVTLTGMAMVTKSITQAGTYSSGTGLFDNSHWKKTIIRLRQLADVPLLQLTKRLDQLQQQLDSLESHFQQRK